MNTRMIQAGLACLLLSGCMKQPGPAEFDRLVEEFVYTTLANSPVLATQAGYHVHRGQRLDELIDDYSESALVRQRLFYRSVRQQLQRIPFSQLDVQRQADYRIVLDQVELALLELEKIQNWRHNPTVYVELAGAALFEPFVREYAPLEERFAHIIARLRRLPRLFEQARQNLTSSPAEWTRVAQEELQGTRALIDQGLRDRVPPQLRGGYDEAARQAIAALQEFDRFLREELVGRTSDWRLGRENYRWKFQYALGTDEPPEQLLAAAEEELERVRRQMYELARPLYRQYFPGRAEPQDPDLVIRQVLDRIAERHATPQTYFEQARRDLREATEFVRRTGLVPLAGIENLQVIPTPEFMRGIYSVGGFNPAPALEPELGAFYWLTPIPEDWPKERIESKLREYNDYGLKLLTIHEAMPGHYVQFEYANRVEPRTRRLVRSLFGNGPYIEGWAVYATEAMLDAGYLDHSPELRLTFLKQQLRMLANAILDIRLHTMGMTDEEAMDLMMRRTFQEEEEARGKLRRAKLSSCQLPTYFAGWRGWHRLRELYRQHRGQDFQLAEFHRRALEAGAVPLAALEAILLGSQAQR